MADCGRLIIGVPNSDPNTPPLLKKKQNECLYLEKKQLNKYLIVNVPPSMSSIASVPFFAYDEKE